MKRPDDDLIEQCDTQIINYILDCEELRSEMIDALIAAHVFIYGVAQHDIPLDGKLYAKTIDQIEQALKKAGAV